MDDLWIFVEYCVDVVVVIFVYDVVVLCFCVFLDCMVDVVEMCVGFDLVDVELYVFVGGLYEVFCED